MFTPVCDPAEHKDQGSMLHGTPTHVVVQSLISSHLHGVESQSFVNHKLRI